MALAIIELIKQKTGRQIRLDSGIGDEVAWFEATHGTAPKYIYDPARLMKQAGRKDITKVSCSGLGKAIVDRM